MPLPLPNLDDRRWLDLTQEALPLIPRYAPGWTDFNTHDPGITLMEMYAWLTKSFIYKLNQVPDRARWKFLSFIGYPRPGPKPAWALLAFEPVPAGGPIHIPAGTQFSGAAVAGAAPSFATTRAIDLSTATLTTLQADPGTGALVDYSLDLADGLPVLALGADPAPGAALYFGFEIIATGSPVAFWLRFGGAGNGASDRERIIAEAAAQAAACQPYAPGWPCNSAAAAEGNCDLALGPVPPHHSARIVWEAFAGGGWTALQSVAAPGRPNVGQVVDDTRSLTLDGFVEVNLPASLAKNAFGKVAAPLYYLRARLADGAYDAPVTLAGAQPNSVAAVQLAPLWSKLAISGVLAPLATPPAAGSSISLMFTLAADLTMQSLSVQSPPAPGQPNFVLLDYLAPLAGDAGSITIALVVLGLGTAAPAQQIFVPGAPVQTKCLRLYTHDGASWSEWTRAADFEASGRTDFTYTLDPMTGAVTCGNGQRGRVFPLGCAIVVVGYTTSADAGNVAAGQISKLVASPINEVELAALSPVEMSLLSQIVANPLAAAGGASPAPLTQIEGDASSVVHARDRILDLADNAQQITLDQIPKIQVLALPAPSQAVNLLDAERIVFDTPGTVVARARAWPDTDPTLPGLHAAGVVTIVILPDMPVAQPKPSPGLIAAVKQYLDRRRVVCTRFAVAAPIYVVITVTATVQASIGASISAVESGVLAALDDFLNPLTGGPAGLGWPFGRGVYNAEILRLIANAPGVDHVTSMTLSADSGAPQCGDIGLCPTYLATSGNHQIQVVSS